MSGRGNGRRGGGILRLGGPSGQGTEGDPKIGGTMWECGHFANAGEGGSNSEEVGVSREQG